MSRAGGASKARRVPMFVLHHRHAAEECGAAYASFKGGKPFSASRLRSPPAATAGTRCGGPSRPHEAEALRLPPYFVVERTTATKVAQIDIP